MRGVVKLAGVLMVVLGAVGILAPLVNQVRHVARRTQCVDNMRQVGMAVHNYYSTYSQRFPAATVPNDDLPPDRRFSWAVEILPFLEGGVQYLLDRKKPWDAEGNCPPWLRRVTDKNRGLYYETPVGDLRIFLCPANPARNGPDLPCPLHYAGVAGVGEAAAELPLTDPKAGFFGYDRTPSAKDIKDGQSNTLMLAEVVDGGPWTAGGPATVRGLAGGTPYLSQGGQFAGLHPGDGFIGSRPVVTNVAFADGHVRGLTEAVSSQVFEGLATIAGGEEVGPW
jgi:prepilin-type processing-associated H-X9-DG protein